jgi:membrane associated rhomboid family serine protease
VSEPTAYGAAGIEQVPVCPRHPDRESYVRCQRCQRPACPECQRTAAVGVQCVDCVAQGQKEMRRTTTVFGGAVAAGRPAVTVGIIGICAAVYAAQLASPNVTSEIAFVPALGESQPWRFLTSAFAHSPSLVLHILFNMYALWIMGNYLEPLLGRARFLATYLISALGGSVVYLLLAFPHTLDQLHAGDYGSWETAAVGASGAVFGLFGAFLVLQRRLGRSAAGMYATLLINAVLGFTIPGIAWQAHLGGFLTGMACAAVIAYTGRKVSAPGEAKGSWNVHWAGLAAITVVLVLASVAKYALTAVPY